MQAFCYSAKTRLEGSKLKTSFAVFCADCPLNDSDGSHLLSNGEEKLAERMVKDLEPRKSLGGLKKKGVSD